jgi:hypothetical protein
MTVDFGQSVSIDELRIHTSYGGARGAAWQVESSSNGATWSVVHTFNYSTNSCGWFNYTW